MTELEKLKTEMKAAEAAWIAADDDAAYVWIAVRAATLGQLGQLGQPEDIAVALLAERDSYNAYEAARARYNDALATHTAEDPDDRVAYEMYAAMADYADTWAKRETSPWYLSIRAAIKRGRELERGA